MSPALQTMTRPDAPPDAARHRQPRELTPAERRIKAWIMKNHAVLSSVAREMNLSTAFVQRIAYNREAKSAGMRVERRLKQLGCPLIQKV